MCSFSSSVANEVSLWTVGMVRPQLWRQTLVLSGLLCCSISNGYIFGQMSGMLAALHAHEDGTTLTDDDISWIASSMSITSVIGFALAAVVTEKIGRRRSITVFSIPIIINWVLMSFAQQMTEFMISRILVGVCFGGVLSMYVLSTPEYTSPNIRALFLNVMNTVGLGIGTSIGHILSLFYHWRTVSLLGVIPTGISAILPFFWEESPSWLASKGRFVECEKAFRQLHGSGQETEKELQVLSEMERCKSQRIKERGTTKLIVALRRKYFWNILLISCVINVYIAAAGKTLFSTLAIDMLEEMTGRKDILLFTLLVDGFVILGSVLGCVFIKVVRMKKLLVTSGVLANLLLLTLSALLYYHPVRNGLVAWLNCLLLAMYFIVVNTGAYPVLEAFIGEIFPLDLKAYFFFLSGIVLGAMMFLTVKLANGMFIAMGYHGVFLLNAAVMTLCLGYLWIKLPETKGRTLQEIELFFKNDTFDEVGKILNGEQIKVLI